MTKIDRKAGEQFHVGAERICLYLKPGDGYSMDGKVILLNTSLLYTFGLILT